MTAMKVSTRETLCLDTWYKLVNPVSGNTGVVMLASIA